MGKSLRSKRARKMRAIKRVRYGQKELARLQDMISKAETDGDSGVVNQGFRLVPPPSSSGEHAKGVKSEEMQVCDTTTVDPKTMKDETGNYPEWLNQKRIKRLRRARQRKAKNQHKSKKR